ncbi:MAG: hypothetical protein C5B48_12870, partial [Candidatus Rokuibacteriota bacterium]
HAAYVSLIASRKRAAVVIEGLKRRGLSIDRLDRLKAPAGLDIGAVTPQEIAVSILAELVQHRRSAKQEPEVVRAEGLDPVCGMVVEIASAKYRSDLCGRAIYFCCAGCKETFDRDPQHYAAKLAG